MSVCISSGPPPPQEAIVSCNNERLNSNEGVAGAINAFCGPAVRKYLDAECGADGCRTGDALRSPTFGLLPAAHIVHTIAPRYTQQYHDAAVYALHRCVAAGVAGGCSVWLWSHVQRLRGVGDGSTGN